MLMADGCGPRRAPRQAAAWHGRGGVRRFDGRIFSRGVIAVWKISIWGGFDGSPAAARPSGPARMDSQPRSTEALKREVSAEDGGSLLAIMRGLWPFIWPTDRPDLQRRVGFSMVLLLAAKLATMAVPFTFKWATDALTGEGTAPVAPSSWLLWVFAAPVAMTIAYGGGRILLGVLPPARGGRFAEGAVEAGRRVPLPTLPRQ